MDRHVSFKLAQHCLLDKRQHVAEQASRRVSKRQSSQRMQHLCAKRNVEMLNALSAITRSRGLRAKVNEQAVFHPSVRKALDSR